MLDPFLSTINYFLSQLKRTLQCCDGVKEWGRESSAVLACTGGVRKGEPCSVVMERKGEEGRALQCWHGGEG